MQDQIDKLKVVRELPISEYQKRFFLEWALDPKGSAYNTSMVYKIEGVINKPAFKRACQIYMSEHEAMHAIYSPDGSKCFYGNYDINDIYCEDTLLPDIPVEKQLAKILNQPFDITKECCIRFYLLQSEKETNTFYFLMNMQHIICDAVMAEIMTDEIYENYLLILTNEDIPKNRSESFTKCVQFEQSLIDCGVTIKTRLLGSEISIIQV